MNAALKGKRKTGNKTVRTPSMSVNEEVAKGGVDPSKGYKKLGTPSVLESPHVGKRKK